MLVVQWQLFKRNAKKCVYFLISVIFGGYAKLTRSITTKNNSWYAVLLPENWRFDGKRATESMSAGAHTEALYIRSISSWDTDWIWCNPGFCSSNAINCQSDLFIQNQIWWAPLIFIIKKLWEKSTRNLSFSIFSPFSTLICGSTTTWTFEIL